jgi:hypothetical protein
MSCLRGVHVVVDNNTTGLNGSVCIQDDVSKVASSWMIVFNIVGTNLKSLLYPGLASLNDYRAYIRTRLRSTLVIDDNRINDCTVSLISTNTIEVNITLTPPSSTSDLSAYILQFLLKEQASTVLFGSSTVPSSVNVTSLQLPLDGELPITVETDDNTWIIIVSISAPIAGLVLIALLLIHFYRGRWPPKRDENDNVVRDSNDNIIKEAPDTLRLAHFLLAIFDLITDVVFLKVATIIYYYHMHHS